MSKKEPDYSEEYDFSDPLSTEVSVEYSTDGADKASSKKPKKKVVKKSSSSKETKPKVAKVKEEKESKEEKEPSAPVSSSVAESKEDEEVKAEPKSVDPSVSVPGDSDPVFEESSYGNPEKKSIMPMVITVLAIIVVIALIFNFGGFGFFGKDNVSDLVTGHAASTVVATVNGVGISQEFIDVQYKSLSPYNQQFITKEMILNKTINEELLLQRAADLGIKVSDKEVKDHVNAILEANDIPEDDFLAQLDEAGLTLDDIYEIYKRQLVISKLIDSELLDQIEVSDQEIEGFYDNNIELFTAGEGEIRASHILVESKEDAEDIIAKLDDGADFAELAKEYSIGPSAPNGGSLGFFGKGVMVPEFEDAAFALDVGQISPPVESQFGWHVIKRDSDVIPLDEARDSIESSLKQEKESSALQVYMSQLRKSAEIAILINNNNKPVVDDNINTEVEPVIDPEDVSEVVEPEVVEVPVEEPGAEPGSEKELTEEPGAEAPEEPATVSENTAAEQIEEAEHVYQFKAECASRFGLKDNAVIVYYATWCSSCQSALDQAAALLNNVYYAASDEASGDVVSECYDVGAGVPQFICSSSGEVLKGAVRDSDLKNFAAECS